jgi:hypothetical protein
VAKGPIAARHDRRPWDDVALLPAEVSLLKAIDPAAFAVIEKLCGVGVNPFAAGAEEGRRATDYACGKLWVAGAIRNARVARMPAPQQQESGPHAVPKGAPPSE